MSRLLTDRWTVERRAAFCSGRTHNKIRHQSYCQVFTLFPRDRSMTVKLVKQDKKENFPVIFQNFNSSCQGPCRSNKVVVSVLMVMIVSYPLFIHNGIVNHKNDKCSHCLSQTDLVSSSISETLLSASNTTVKKCVQNVLPKTCPWAIFDKPYSL